MYEISDLVYKDLLNIPELIFKKHTSTAITGASGAGKTTLLKLLDGLFRINSGTILYDGTNITEIKNLRQRVTMIAQNPVVYPDTLYDNFKKTSYFCDKPLANDEVLTSFLKLCALDLPLDTDTKMLSGGEKSRLSIARALSLESETYLLDEPTSALDAQTMQIVMQNLLHFTKEHHMTTLIVTHSAQTAELCSHEVVIKKGGLPQWVR
ncbi:MAG: ABC transporter ATP-binding protein [Christensenellaceae bacterium]